MFLHRLILLLAVILSGCVSALPPHSPELGRQLSQAVDAIGELDAAVAIPQADHSFKALQPHYVKALASLKSARRIAEQRAAGARGGLSERPAEISTRTIDNCIASLDLLMQLNVTKALEPRDLDAFPVQSTCSIAKLTEGDLKREAGNG